MDILLRMTLRFPTVLNASEFQSLELCNGEIRSPYRLKNYHFINLGHKAISGLLADIRLKVIPDLPTVGGHC